MKRVIISGGGTGGHIYPALTIAEEISKIEETEFLYVGSKNGLESEIVPKHGIPFATLELQSLARTLTVKNFVALYKSTKAMIQARKIIRDFKPDLVIGTGGYVCGPILLAAALMGIPTIIQEQNVVAGVTNRILSRFVDAVAVGYEEAKSSFKNCKKVVYTGNPVRPEVLAHTREEGRKAFAVNDKEVLILVAGGSRGARSVNTAMIPVHKALQDCDGVRVLHATGTGEYKRVLQSFGKDADEYKDGFNFGAHSRIVPYLHDMPKALAATDLAIFRAGAVGLAELTVRGIPSILIPYPYASEDHQTFNAKVLADEGAAVMIADRDLTGEGLLKEIKVLIESKEKLEKMHEASLKMGNPEASREIAKLALSLAK